MQVTPNEETTATMGRPPPWRSIANRSQIDRNGRNLPKRNVNDNIKSILCRHCEQLQQKGVVSQPSPEQRHNIARCCASLCCVRSCCSREVWCAGIIESMNRFRSIRKVEQARFWIRRERNRIEAIHRFGKSKNRAPDSANIFYIGISVFSP